METKKCPFCGKTVLAISNVCKHCGRSFEEPAQEEKPEPTIFQSQSTINETTSVEPVVPIPELAEQELSELFQTTEEEPENNETDPSNEVASSQPEPIPFVDQQQDDVSQQNFDKRGSIKTIKWIIYVLGGILLISGFAFGVLKLNKQNPQSQKSVQAPKEDTVRTKQKMPSYLGLEPTILYSAPAEITTSSGERFKVEAADYFIGTLDEKGNPENGKLYDKSGRPKHVILPRRNN